MIIGIPEEVKKLLKKQHYEIVGGHSAVQICRWTKNSIKSDGVCYKEKFYGIKCHRCCQMTPAVMWCQNKCLHCWRAIEHTLGKKLSVEKINSPSEIIDGCIKAQRKLLLGFKNHRVTDMEKYNEAQEPTQFAISLSGEPTIYPKIGELILELRRRGKTSFLVTNGLLPEKLEKLKNKNQLPTQLYVSVNASNKKLYDKIHRSSVKNAWEVLNKTLELMPELKNRTRTIFRMNLVKDLNMNNEHVEEYANLIKKAQPLFVEVKGFMSVGYARQRLGYERMPTNKEMEKFVKKIATATGLKLLDKHERSRAFVLGKKSDGKNLKIQGV